MEMATKPKRIEAQPKLVLEKIADYLNGRDLLTFSQTSRELFHFFSKIESIWNRKLIRENLKTNSPRLIQKAEDIEDLFPVSCFSKRIFLLRKKIRQNVRSGMVQKVAEKTIGTGILPWALKDLVMNDDLVAIFTFGRIDFFKTATGQWSHLYFLPVQRWHLMKAIISGHFVAATIHNLRVYTGVPDMILVANTEGEEPRICWTRDFLDCEYLLAETKIFRVKKGTGILEELDVATGSTVRTVLISNYIGGGEFRSDNLFVYVVDFLGEKFMKVVDVTSSEAILTLPGEPQTYFLPSANGSLPIMVNCANDLEPNYNILGFYWAHEVNCRKMIRCVGQKSGRIFALYPKYPSPNSEMLIYDVVGCDRQSVSLSSRKMKLGPSSGEERVRLDDGGHVELGFGRDVGLPNLPPINWPDLEQDHLTLYQSVFILDDLILKSTRSMGQPISVAVIDSNSGNIINQFDVSDNATLAAQLYASTSGLVVLFNNQVRIFDFANTD